MPVIICPNCHAKNRVDADRARLLQPVCAKCHARLPAPGAHDKPIEVTDGTFDERVLEESLPVLVDCWAPWCGPCRMVAPTIDQLAAESGGRYVVAKLNTDENPRVAGQYRIDAIPTLLIFHRGQVVDRIVGLQPKNAIADRLDRIAVSA
jgi:thioredoxin